MRARRPVILVATAALTASLAAIASGMTAGTASAGTASAVTANAGTQAADRPAASDDDEETEPTVPNPHALSGSCGVERWSVKTGSDSNKNLINFSVVKTTTIAALGAIHAPSSLPANSRVKPTETTVFHVSATLTEYKLESDSDIHLVLTDASGHTMIAEIPDPACVSSSSVLLSRIKNSRNEFDAKYKPTSSFQQANVPVAVNGVGFFDFKHGQTGVAPNAIELHAVTNIRFLG